MPSPLQLVHNEHPIVGESLAIRRVLDQVSLVAPAHCAVLLRGETGTGKELVARAVHEQSLRAHAPFIRLNCAAIPAGLLESELFGHERGAFTGAVAQRVGRLELAHGGTLFLDEIGDLPLELQPKLLRALQEREFERLGSSRTIRVDVRIIAATHQNLAEMVNQRRFRADLYYRLNVFLITLPPLRDRPSDIPHLVRRFVAESAARMNKRIDEIPAPVLDILRRYSWPGNVRELQNFVERAVLMSPGRTFQPPMAELTQFSPPSNEEAVRTLAEVERGCIAAALHRANWVVGGRAGAAVSLGMPRTTLLARMRKLGISRENYALRDSVAAG